MASSLMELSVGGGGQTKLSIMSTLRALGIVDIGGGSVKKKRVLQVIFYGIEKLFYDSIQPKCENRVSVKILLLKKRVDVENV